MDSPFRMNSFQEYLKMKISASGPRIKILDQIDSLLI